MNQPKISIVTPSYNCAPYIRQCIESVASQDYPNFEHIIMDGGSQDGTVEILQEYPHLIWVSERDKGEAHALNKALSKVTGEIVGWLNADDFYMPEIFPVVADAIDPLHQRHAVYGNTDFLNDEGELIVRQRSTPVLDLPHVLRWWDYRNRPLPRQPSIFYSKQLMDDIGPFREDLYYSIDYEHMLRAVVKYHFVHRDQIFATARIRANSKAAEDLRAQHRYFRNISRPYYFRLSLIHRLLLRSDFVVRYLFESKLENIRIKLGLRTRVRRLLGQD